MNARLLAMGDIEEEDNKPRLYSKQPRLPVDEIAPQHQEIHYELERWGAWNAERYKADSCLSVESRYREQTAHATGKSVDPKLIALERAVLQMPVDHRSTIRLFYVERRPPSLICRMFTIKTRAFPAWMFTARCMVVNLLRRNA